MNITLIDTTPKVYATYVPLALLRLSAKHKLIGDNVELVPAKKLPRNKPDQIYFSLIFLFDYKKDCEWILAYRKKYPDVKITIGGISPTLLYDKFQSLLKGKDIQVFKDRDYQLEQLKPDFDIAKIDYSYGFTTRGCPNKCDWCVVPKLEGMHNMVENWQDTIDEKKKTFFAFDNNIFACGSKHFENVLKYCHDNNIKIDCNQGMDAEILHKNKKIQEIFLKYPKVWHKLRFAWDSDRVNESIIFTMDFITKNISNNLLLYMLYDTDESPEKVFKRIKKCLDNYNNIEIKLMRFKDLDTGKLLRKWGGLGDLFADSVAFVGIGLITNRVYWQYLFGRDFNHFINASSLVRQYVKSVKTLNANEFINFAEKKLTVQFENNTK